MLLFQKFSEKQDAQPPLLSFLRFLLAWALGEILHHLSMGSLGQDGRQLLLTHQARQKVRRKPSAYYVLVTGLWTFLSSLFSFSHFVWHGLFCPFYR